MPNPNLNLAAIGLDRQQQAAAALPLAAQVSWRAWPGPTPAPVARPLCWTNALLRLWRLAPASAQPHPVGPLTPGARALPPPCPAAQQPGMDPNERVFVGGLPYYLTEEQCRELLGAFGAIKTFDLVKDRETGQSKGCARQAGRGGGGGQAPGWPTQHVDCLLQQRVCGSARRHACAWRAASLTHAASAA